MDSLRLIIKSENMIFRTMVYSGACVRGRMQVNPALGSLVSNPARELDALRSLDPEAVTEIHKRYFEKVFRYAYFRLGDPMLAEDIASETFVRLLEAVSRGRGPHTTLQGWLLGTTANLVKDHFAKTSAIKLVDLPDDIVEDEPHPDELSDQTERYRSLHNALFKLTEDQKHVLALRFGGAHSLIDTAELLNKTPNAVKALQFRALAALRRLLDEEML
ncbi:MAG: sigma-70 family RNA polymerase sigma factor [Anaerolineales bacterium]|nr:sigma-70 family RNA polymerase sigma factor [Anaerolineales bacterium]